ncbi:hypothetical protein ACSFA3_04355 [Variovorax sp. RHLX14]|uniref:hypothetical protein n=1 Tax=Variovorax sp. RHLX14 TaxID=1259731 RepID=UPI003F446D74
MSVCSLAAGLMANAPALAAGDLQTCRLAASPDCYFGFDAPGTGGTLRYYASLPARANAASAPISALIALHGHPRDADKTFDATLKAVRGADAIDRILVVAPVFQVDADRSRECRTPGVPAAVPGDALWTCGSWMEGGRANTGLTSFAALDALVAEVARQWPSLRTVTVAGFSAGAQMVQHYIGFANVARAASPGVAMRYVVSDPGTWLYFDAMRPQPPAAGSCPEIDRWKYGTEALPAWLGRDAATARQRYAEADIHYVEGELDSGDSKGTYYRILDKSCAAMAQGADRLQRGIAYAAYDRAALAPQKQRHVTVVPGCAHDVACVFPSPTARAALIGPYALPQR